MGWPPGSHVLLVPASNIPVQGSHPHLSSVSSNAQVLLHASVCIFFPPQNLFFGISFKNYLECKRDICWGWNVSSFFSKPYCFNTRKTKNQFVPLPSAHTLWKKKKKKTKLIAGTSDTRQVEKKNPKPCSTTLTAFHVLWGFHLQWLWIKVSVTQNLMPIFILLIPCWGHALDLCEKTLSGLNASVLFESRVWAGPQNYFSF